MALDVKEINFKDAGGCELTMVLSSGGEEAAVELGTTVHLVPTSTCREGKEGASSMEQDRTTPAPSLGTLRGGSTSGNPDTADRTWINPVHPLCSQNPPGSGNVSEN